MDLQEQYFTKASEAYGRKEYKYCLVLLKKVELNEYKNVNLLVNCSYDYWKQTVIATSESRAVSRNNSRPNSRPGTANAAFSSTAFSSTKFTGIEQKSISELLSGTDEPLSKDFQTVLDAIKESFTKLLANVNVVPIKQYDYIRLTHVYLTEGSLHGALQILQLASARGFLEDPLVVLQSYTIMRRISKEVDVLNTMTYLSSTLVIEAIQRKRSSTSQHGQRVHKIDRFNATNSNTLGNTLSSAQKSLTALRTTLRKDGLRLNLLPLTVRESIAQSIGTTLYVSDSDLPLQYMYLHCASFIQRQAQLHRRPATTYQKYLSELTAVLSEAYFLVRNEVNEDVSFLLAWFNDPQLWYDMGLSLDVNTPYVLLAQDSFWESFTRSPLEDAHIRAHINSLIRNKQKGNVPALLAQVMEINPWNLFVRDSLYELDMQLVADPHQRHWAQMFDHDEHYCSKVQKHVRGWLLRKHWDEVLRRISRRKELYQERKQKALQKFALFWRTHQRTVWMGWREFVEETKQTKFQSSSSIQALYRGRLWRYWYVCYRQRIAQANYMYLIACNRVRDQRRVRTFQKWYGEYFKLKQKRSADLICDVLYMNGYSRVLRAGMDFLISVLRVKRRYLYKRMMQHWREKWARTRIQRARTTIRFFVRRCYGRKAEAEKEIQLAQVMEVLNQKAQVSFRKSDLPLIRTMWARWFSLFMKIAHAERLDRLAQQLAVQFFLKRGRAIRRGLRARVEAQSAFVKRTWFLKMIGIFLPWRMNAGARKIQRAARVWRATKVYKRLLKINYGVGDMIHEKKCAIMRRIIWRWKKYNYLVYRERYRAARWIVRLFRMIMLRGLIRRKCAAKISLGNFAYTVHRAFTGLSLRRLKARTVYASRYVAISRMNDALRKGVLRGGFYIWARLLSAQFAAHRLVYVQSTRRIEKLCWVGAANRVTMRVTPAPSLDFPEDDPHGGAWASPEDHPDIASVNASISGRLQALIQSSKAYEARYKTFEIYTPANPVVLLDNEQRWQLRAFQAWTALYRLRQRYIRDTARPLATHIAALAQQWSLRRLSAAFRIQNLYRSFHARQYANAVRTVARREAERLLRVQHTVERKILVHAWATLAKARRYYRHTIVRMQSLIRKFMARRNFHVFYQRYAHLQGSGTRVRQVHRLALLQKYMHLFQLQYCYSLARAVTAVNPDARRRFAALGQDEPVRAAKKVKITSRDAAFARLQSKQIKHSKSVDTLAVAPRGTEGDRLAGQAVASFQSEESRQHLLRLRETGVLIFDSSTTASSNGTPETRASTAVKRTAGKRVAPSADSQEPRAHPQLSDEELVFCLENADTVYCHQTRKAALRSIVTHFSGKLLVLRQGELTSITVSAMLYKFLRAQDSQASSSLASQPLSLQLSSVSMGLTARMLLIRSLADQTPVSARQAAGATEVMSPQHYVSRISEIAVDSDTMGILGINVLLASLQFNSALRTLAVKHSVDDGLSLSYGDHSGSPTTRVQLGSARLGGYLQSTGACAELLSRNTSLQELRFFGTSLPVPLLRGLLRGVRTGFAGLRVLEFSLDVSGSTEPFPGYAPWNKDQQKADPLTSHSAVFLAECIIEAAKDRAYAGRQGLAVTVNYR